LTPSSAISGWFAAGGTAAASASISPSFQVAARNRHLGAPWQASMRFLRVSSTAARAGGSGAPCRTLETIGNMRPAISAQCWSATGAACRGSAAASAAARMKRLIMNVTMPC
jgi:hypothetical protein